MTPQPHLHLYVWLLAWVLLGAGAMYLFQSSPDSQIPTQNTTFTTQSVNRQNDAVAVEGVQDAAIEQVSMLEEFMVEITSDFDLALEQEKALEETWLAKNPTKVEWARVAFTNCEDVTQIPVAECQALVDIYTSTDGANWVFNEGWLQNNEPCDRDGVGCHDGHVSFFIPNYYGMKGAIPASIGNLTELKILALNNNQLSGPLPDTIGNLVALERLSIHENQLSGPLPSSIGNLTKLRQLIANDNQFNWALPTTIWNLTSLEVLMMYNNKLSGKIPTTIGNLSKLRDLVLPKNQLQGWLPNTLGNLTELNQLNLWSNQLSWPLPTSFANLDKLHEGYGLLLNENKFCGKLPADMHTRRADGSVPKVSLSNNKFITNNSSYTPAMQAWIAQNINRWTQMSAECVIVTDPVPVPLPSGWKIK